MWFFDFLKCAPMDVRKLVVALCVVTLVAVAIVLFLQQDVAETGRPPNNPAIAEHVETRHGPALRAIGVRSLGWTGSPAMWWWSLPGVAGLAGGWPGESRPGRCRRLR
jgi:hypothetical protein